MKSITPGLALTLLLGLSMSDAAWADRGRTRAHVGIYFGAPLVFSPWHHPVPYYGPNFYPNFYPHYGRYYQVPPAIITDPAPVYIERGSSPGPSDTWYYCSNPDGYHPYVKECPGGWQKVTP